jgi:hypothetical protein
LDENQAGKASCEMIWTVFLEVHRCGVKRISMMKIDTLIRDLDDGWYLDLNQDAIWYT